MAFVYADRVQEVTTSTGTGIITLGGASTGYQAFSTAFVTGSQIYYSMSDHTTGDWETGYGTLTSGTNWTLSRNVLESSNANSLVSFAAGTKTIFCTWPALMAAKATNFNGALGGGNNEVFQENDNVVTTNYTIGANAFLSGMSITIATPAVFTLANHGFAAGQQIKFETTGVLPTGLAVDTTYYVIATGLTASDFQVSATDGGTAIATSGTQSGVHSVAKIKNAVTGGPVTIATGVVVTIPTNSVWTIV